MVTAKSTHSIQASIPRQIDIELVYARPDKLWRLDLRIAAHSTVRDAIVSSGFLDQFPDVHIDTVKCGIYGQQCGLDRTLNPGDRIEVYRPLIFDPMESRRRRAQHRQRNR